jgi:hypothetical protein
MVEPRYLSEIASVSILGIVQISARTSTNVLGLKNTLDFATLTNCPEDSQYEFRISPRPFALSSSAYTRINESSANKRCETDGASQQTFTPSITPISSACDKRLDSPSEQIKNRYGDNGSPCLRPLVGVN